jgi:hypothetical protein
MLGGSAAMDESPGELTLVETGRITTFPTVPVGSSHRSWLQGFWLQGL